jgi:hypothetical protein
MTGRCLPIGIDEIVCTITYRELFIRSAPPGPSSSRHSTCAISTDPSLRGSATWPNYLLDRTAGDFGKVLVTVSVRERAEILHEALARP